MNRPAMARTKDFCRTIGVEYNTALRWFRDGRVPGAVRMGRGMWMIPWRTLDGLANGTLRVERQDAT